MDTSIPEATGVVASPATQDSSSTSTAQSADNVELTHDEQGVATSTSQDNTTTQTDEGTQSTDSETHTQKPEQPKFDEDLQSWAETRGYGELTTDKEKRMAQDARNNQRAFSKGRSNKTEVQDEVTDLYQPDSDDSLSDDEQFRQSLMMNQARLEAKLQTRDFFDANPEAREYETKMAELIKEEREKYGEDSARFLARDLNRLLIFAKSSGSPVVSADDVEAARKEERESLAKKQSAVAPSARANTHAPAKETNAEEALSNMSVQEWRDKKRQGWNPIRDL